MITQDYLQSIFNYDQKTGIFTRKITRNPRFKAGTIAGQFDKDGYIVICIDGKNYKAHRLAWLYVYGYMPENLIDHINGKANDNRIVNLRECNVYENQYNSKLSARNKSGIKGVSFHKLTKKWQAMINVNGKQKYFGIFESKELAELIVNEARKKYHGDFFNIGKGENRELR